MTQTDVLNLEEITEVVKKWWLALQHERKCNTTNTLYKLVSRSTNENQEHVRKLIAFEIKNVVDECMKSNDLRKMQIVCNAINGCFDNFTHALDAVSSMFVELITFIDFGIRECQTKLAIRENSRNYILELLHSFSRILILTLKLKRTQNFQKGKQIVKQIINDEGDRVNLEISKSLFCNLLLKIGQFLIADDILIDTKNNLAMSAVLIREIMIKDEEKLREYHRKFVETLPTQELDENFKLSILKFLMSSAIINTWSINIIDCHSTCIYLKFLILLCENYSSETPVILNTSRTLLLLIKHESFKIFIQEGDEKTLEPVVHKLLSCIFMLLEHPVPCIRHSAKDFLHLIAAMPSLQQTLIDMVFQLPCDKRSFYIGIGALANEIGSRDLIQSKRQLPNQLISALHDPTIVSHVSLALEFIILNDALAETNFSEWCELWIVPLLSSLVTVMPIVAADIEKLLGKTFKKYPKSLFYVTNKWAQPESEDELRYVVTALKISQKQGVKLKSNSSHCVLSTDKKNTENNCDIDLLDEKLMEHCLHQREDDIRISAFSLLIEAHKSTNPYSKSNFRLIQYFLKYNLNNHQPATRQKVLGLLRKMFVRFSDSKATFLKAEKNEKIGEEVSKNIKLYDEFLNSLVEFCFENIFVGCNFNRLNTVLNILVFSFEYVKNMSFDAAKSDYYWEKLLIALDSSYEENKELAVILSKKLNYSTLNANKPEQTKFLYEKAFNLCCHMEPPDVLTGSYLLKSLTNFPSSKEVLEKYFVREEVEHVGFCCIRILCQKLKEQLDLAELDLLTAATCGPMYGTLFTIRLILKDVDFSEKRVEGYLKNWAEILNDVLEMSFKIIHCVGCVVNSSSPEGHLPNDFLTDFEFNLPENFSQDCRINEISSTNQTADLIKSVSENLFFNYKKIEDAVRSGDKVDSYETLRTLKCLHKKSSLLIKTLGENEHLKNELETIRNQIEKFEDFFEKSTSIVEWPATAQVLLLCAWRSIKEASLFVGDLITKLPVETAIELKLLTQQCVVKMGEELKILLCEIKHRGAFEHAYIGFSLLINSLWKCSRKDLNELPQKWLQEILNHLESPEKYQKLKFCATRRSAGLPFLIQAIICSEIVSVKSVAPSTLHSTINSLLKIAESDGGAQESKIHSLNILRALFKHFQLGEYVASYVARALKVAIRGSRASSWSERNSSSLLFSSLIIRIFGVARSRDEISKKNRMTSRTFFQRYSELYDFLISEMKFVHRDENFSCGLDPKPSLYLVLLILGRLYPPPTEDSENIDLSEFLPFIDKSCKNPIMKIRELGARALVPLIPLSCLVDELNRRFSKLSKNSRISQNERHGILLQIKSLLIESKEVLETIQKANLTVNVELWIEHTKWILQINNASCYVSLSTYVKVLHVLFQNFSPLKKKITEVVTDEILYEDLLLLKDSQQRILPGFFVFLENLFFLKTDVLGQQWSQSSDVETREKFVELIKIMLRCSVSEVQAIPFRMLCYMLRENSIDFEDDEDFARIGAGINDLLLFKSPDACLKLKREVFSNSEVMRIILEGLNKKNNEDFKSKTVCRLWLSAASCLILNNMIFISHSDEAETNSSLKIDLAKFLINSSDKHISENALIIYSAYLMEELSTSSSGKMSTEDRRMLFEILHKFSSDEADFKERVAVAKILNRCHKSLIHKKFVEDPLVLSIWMISFKLLADDDVNVRILAGELVHELQDFILKHKETDELIIEMKTLHWPRLPLVSLKAQECLLDIYVNLLGEKNLLYLVVQMFVMALSSLCGFEGNVKSAKDDFGVFEKGNPNPFCESLILSNLMCSKLKELSSAIDLKALLHVPLDRSLIEYISQRFHFSRELPDSLIEILDAISSIFETTEKFNREFSLSLCQIRNLRKVFCVDEPKP